MKNAGQPELPSLFIRILLSTLPTAPPPPATQPAQHSSYLSLKLHSQSEWTKTLLWTILNSESLPHNNCRGSISYAMQL